jgi:hypothetical protein
MSSLRTVKLLSHERLERHSTQAAAAADLSVKVQYDVGFAPADAGALESLIATRPEVGVFVSRAWLSGLFDESPEGCGPLLVVLRHAGMVCAIAPIAIRRTLNARARRVAGRRSRLRHRLTARRRRVRFPQRRGSGRASGAGPRAVEARCRPLFRGAGRAAQTRHAFEPGCCRNARQIGARPRLLTARAVSGSWNVRPRAPRNVRPRHPPGGFDWLR